jgi:hypothetical protein
MVFVHLAYQALVLAIKRVLKLFFSFLTKKFLDFVQVTALLMKYVTTVRN